jgi:hypothetical protein
MMFDSSLIYVVFWMATSCAMVRSQANSSSETVTDIDLLFVQILFNKAVLSTMEFPFPMFITTWHMLFATVLTQVLSRTTDMLPGVKEVSLNSNATAKAIIEVIKVLSDTFILFFSKKSTSRCYGTRSYQYQSVSPSASC